MERTTWQVKIVDRADVGINDFGDWEPFAVDHGRLFVRKQTVVEGDKSSHEPGMPSFAERHERPYQQPDPED